MITRDRETHIEAACFSITGHVRSKNEDNYCLNSKYMAADHGDKDVFSEIENDDCSMAVFDGIGGESKGERASYIAAKIFAKAGNIQGNPDDFMIELTDKMNEGISDFMHRARVARMGATMAALLFKEGRVYGMNMGDSRIYIYRKGFLSQLSNDQAIIRPGHIRRRLLQYLGAYNQSDKMLPDMFKMEVQSGDIFIACTDGLTDMLTNNDIQNILYQEGDIYSWINGIKSEVERRGAIDNTTVIMAKVN